MPTAEFTDESKTKVIVRTQDGKTFICDVLPKAKQVRYNGTGYSIVSVFYNLDNEILVFHKNEYTPPLTKTIPREFEVKPLSEFIESMYVYPYVPSFGKFGVQTLQSTSLILQQSKILKNCFRLTYPTKRKKDIFLAIIEHKAEKFGINLVINYRNSDEFDIKCPSEEDLAMFLMYFHAFL